MVDTGWRGNCHSNWGACEMVGNVLEWVADWGALATDCTSWSSDYGTDYSCLGGNDAVHLPGALIRNGGWLDGTSAGVFAVLGNRDPSHRGIGLEFRCAR